MKNFLAFIAVITLVQGVGAQSGTPTRPADQKEKNSSAASEKAEETTDGTRVPVSTGKYITGGVLGSTLGFGIGHGVQGRYGSKGWIFTATEAASLSLILAGCRELKDTDNDGDKDECNNNGLAAFGYVALVGFHIWEIIDVWRGATPVQENSPAVFLLPDPKAPKIGIAWQF